jgi:hypothetical protein
MTRPGSRSRRGAHQAGPAPGADAAPLFEVDTPDPAAADPVAPDPVATDPVASESAGDTAHRPTGMRLARVHLRTGALGLARAELESYAGRDLLDDDALLDLAEVRWRTGDLAGAGEAAGMLLDRGREDVLALVIAAEAISGEGRPGEARRLVARALARADGPLDALFAGMPRGAVWPDTGAVAPSAASERPGEPGVARGPRHAQAALAAAALADADAPATTAAAEAYAGGRAALGAGDQGLAALRLGVALRLEPGFAEGVLEAIGDGSTDPALALVAGDALRLMGREAEALAAFDRARGHVATGDPGPSTPGA